MKGSELKKRLKLKIKDDVIQKVMEERKQDLINKEELPTRAQYSYVLALAKLFDHLDNDGTSNPFSYKGDGGSEDKRFNNIRDRLMLKGSLVDIALQYAYERLAVHYGAIEKADPRLFQNERFDYKKYKKDLWKKIKEKRETKKALEFIQDHVSPFVDSIGISYELLKGNDKILTDLVVNPFDIPSVPITL